MDTSDRDLTFDADGVCHHCRTVPARLQQSWLRGPEGQAALDQLIDRIRKSGKGRTYDCIIGLSGGVDSSWLALKAKDWGLRVLAFHSDAGWNSELAVQNIEHLTNYCGFDLQTDILPWEEVRDVQLAYLKAGVLNQDVPQDQGFFASLYKATRQFKIRYNLDGANLSTECVLPASYVGYSNSRDARNLVAIHKTYGTIPLREYPLLSVFKTLLYRNGIFMDIASPLNFMEYNKPAALEELRQRAGYKPYDGKHGESVFTKFYQDYFLPKRFNIDKRRAHLSSLVITKQTTRDDALAELDRPPLTPNEEEMILDYICTKLRLSRAEFDAILAQPTRDHSEFANSRRLEALASKYLMWPVRKWRRLRGITH